MRTGDEPADDFVTVDCTSSALLAWMIGRSPGEPSWPALAPWQGVP